MQKVAEFYPAAEEVIIDWAREMSALIGEPVEAEIHVGEGEMYKIKRSALTFIKDNSISLVTEGL